MSACPRPRKMAAARQDVGWKLGSLPAAVWRPAACAPLPPPIQRPRRCTRCMKLVVTEHLVEVVCFCRRCGCCVPHRVLLAAPEATAVPHPPKICIRHDAATKSRGINISHQKPRTMHTTPFSTCQAAHPRQRNTPQIRKLMNIHRQLSHRCRNAQPNMTHISRTAHQLPPAPHSPP